MIAPIKFFKIFGYFLENAFFNKLFCFYIGEESPSSLLVNFILAIKKSMVKSHRIILYLLAGNDQKLDNIEVRTETD
jgi:hypothetical protein